MKSERVENWWRGSAWCLLNAQKVWSWNKFKKIKCLCNRRVFVWNPDASKEIVHFVHEVDPVFAVPSQLFSTCYVGEIMIPCQVSTFSKFICSACQFQGHLAQNKSWNAWKIANEVRYALKSDDVVLNGAYWMQKKYWVKICLKKWNPFVIDKFSSETLILRRRLSSLYTKCIQFFP